MIPDRTIYLAIIGVAVLIVWGLTLESENQELRSRTCEVAAQEPSPPQFHIDEENHCVCLLASTVQEPPAATEVQ